MNVNLTDLTNVLAGALAGAVIGGLISYFIMKSSNKHSEKLEVSKRKREYCDSLAILLGQYYAEIDNCKDLFEKCKRAEYIAGLTKKPNDKEIVITLELKYETYRTQVKRTSSTIVNKLSLVIGEPGVAHTVDAMSVCLSDIDSYFRQDPNNLAGLGDAIQKLKTLWREFITGYR